MQGTGLEMNVLCSSACMAGEHIPGRLTWSTCGLGLPVPVGVCFPSTSLGSAAPRAVDGALDRRRTLTPVVLFKWSTRCSCRAGSLMREGTG